MLVTLIDYTGAGSSDPLYAAKLLAYTKNTRLTQGEDTRARFAAMTWAELEPELDYISKTLRSSWEFIDFVFEIKDVTRAFTHQLVRTRTASYAQQAQRVVDMSHFSNEMPATVQANELAEREWEEVMKRIGEGYAFLQSLGIPNQDCRGVLPTNVHTNIIVKLNLRTFADLVGKRDNMRAQGEYVDVIRGMKDEALTVMPWIKPFLYPERTATPAIDKLMAFLLGDGSPIDKPEVNAALKELDTLKGIWG